ncbi:DNA polymerase epsilon catalytic subunit, partial [Coemansia sp. RSA 25]
MQGVANPVPRIRHPDWLSKRVAAALNKHKQRHITDVFKRVSKEEYLQKAAAEDERLQLDENSSGDEGPVAAADMEDFGIAGSSSSGGGGGAIARPKTGVARKAVVAAAARRRGADARLAGDLGTAEGISARLAQLGVAPSPSNGYAAWLRHAKQAWALRRRLRGLRAKNADRSVAGAAAGAATDGIGQFFARTQQALARSVWHVLQWEETDTPGELKAWVLVGGHVQAVCVAVPRVLYVTSAVASAEIAGSRFFSEARGMVLPRSSMGHGARLYKCVMAEAEFAAFRSSWSAFFAHPSIGGVYETEVTCLDRALIQLGAAVWLRAGAAAAGRGDAVALDDLDSRRSASLAPHQQPAPPPAWAARDMNYALLFHAGSQDGRRHFYALVMPYAARGHVWV